MVDAELGGGSDQPVSMHCLASRTRSHPTKLVLPIEQIAAERRIVPR